MPLSLPHSSRETARAWRWQWRCHELFLAVQLLLPFPGRALVIVCNFIAVNNQVLFRNGSLLYYKCCIIALLGGSATQVQAPTRDRAGMDQSTREILRDTASCVIESESMLCTVVVVTKD